jgi:integrase
LEENDYGAIIKMVALTGQRPGEIAGLKWSQIHNGSIILEGGDASGGTKNYHDHHIPYSFIRASQTDYSGAKAPRRPRSDFRPRPKTVQRLDGLQGADQ